MRALGIDFGRSRIGVAVGESANGVVSPRSTIAASGTLSKDAQAISKLAKDEQATTVVLGLPLDADGETKASKIVRRLGGEIASCGLDVEYVDESMTSQDAERDMAEAGLKGSGRRKRSDAEAACRILERFFEGR